MFFYATNNGIRALVTEETYHRIQMLKERRRNWEGPEPFPEPVPIVPIFTFGPADRLVHQPWLTGTYELFDHLIGTGGGLEEQSFFVPFSNQYDLADNGQEVRIYATTGAQLIDAFGVEALSPSALLATRRLAA